MNESTDDMRLDLQVPTGVVRHVTRLIEAEVQRLRATPLKAPLAVELEGTTRRIPCIETAASRAGALRDLEAFGVELQKHLDVVGRRRIGALISGMFDAQGHARDLTEAQTAQLQAALELVRETSEEPTDV